MELLHENIKIGSDGRSKASLKEVEMNTISQLKRNAERLRCIYWPLIEGELVVWNFFGTDGALKRIGKAEGARLDLGH